MLKGWRKKVRISNPFMESRPTSFLPLRNGAKHMKSTKPIKEKLALFLKNSPVRISRLREKLKVRVLI